MTPRCWKARTIRHGVNAENTRRVRRYCAPRLQRGDTAAALTAARACCCCRCCPEVLCAGRALLSAVAGAIARVGAHRRRDRQDGSSGLHPALEDPSAQRDAGGRDTQHRCACAPVGVGVRLVRRAVCGIECRAAQSRSCASACTSRTWCALRPGAPASAAAVPRVAAQCGSAPAPYAGRLARTLRNRGPAKHACHDMRCWECCWLRAPRRRGSTAGAARRADAFT